MIKIVLSLLLLFSSTVLTAQDADTTALPEPYITKEFVIVQSVKNYPQALATAKAAAAKLKLQLDLRNLKPGKSTGLTLPKKECEEYYSYPCYIARGRYDDGNYVSIEYSTQYEGFKKGFYIVVISSWSQGEAELNITLKKAKAVYADAYKKKSRVYVGCIH
jgi:hypothetical protein